jgi:ubiquinone/menaquinone biosynthesis C-methylase UbiE
MKMLRMMMLLAGIFCGAIIAPLPAQEKSVRPGVNKSFENPDVGQFIERFEREGREIFDQRKKIFAACRLKPGMAMADVGAGTGLYTRMFSPAVGVKGKVYAVDISQKFVDHVTADCKKLKMTNVEGVVCKPFAVNLPAESIDLAFICATYHHFEYPYKTMRSIHSALRDGGQVIIVDFKRIEGVSSEWIMGHVRAGQDVVTREVLKAGFKLVGEEKFLKESYVMRFEKVAEATSNDKVDYSKVKSHRLTSPRQAEKTRVRVLLPDKIEEGKQYRTLYVLPVEPGHETRWGDPVKEVLRTDLHNRYDLVCVFPEFSHLPWFANHATDSSKGQERYFLRNVIPLIERHYPVLKKKDGRLLVGFSKSGWGAWSLLLRHPDKFARAAAWDAPLMKSRPDQFGMGPIFGTQENFEKYQISKLLEPRAEQLRYEKRLGLFGYGGFRTHHQQMHRRLDELKIPHAYADGPQRKHDWHSGWLAEAVEFLVAE